MNSENKKWMKKLSYNKKGIIENKIGNILLILENDNNISGLYYNPINKAIELKKPVPWRHPNNQYWRDIDKIQLVCYLEDKYGSFSKGKINTALAVAIDNASFYEADERVNYYDQ